MRFYIVTPSFNQVAFLQLCIESVRDQIFGSFNPLSCTISVHHHIQDGGSTDGTIELLKQYKAKSSELPTGGYSFSYSSEQDDGMYDAINRGWKRADEDVTVVAHLNCDEQYLQGALKKVGDFFRRHKDVGVVHADVIVTEPDGAYICSRRSITPNRKHILTSHLPTFTASTFIRESVIREHQLYFDSAWKACGDAVWTLMRMDMGVRAMVMRDYTTMFVDSGGNMSLGTNASRERVLLGQRAAPWVRYLKCVWVLQHRLRKLVSGGYSHAPFDYTFFQDSSDGLQRVLHHVDRASGVWKKRL